MFLFDFFRSFLPMHNPLGHYTSDKNRLAALSPNRLLNEAV